MAQNEPKVSQFSAKGIYSLISGLSNNGDAVSKKNPSKKIQKHHQAPTKPTTLRKAANKAVKEIKQKTQTHQQRPKGRPTSNPVSLYSASSVAKMPYQPVSIDMYPASVYSTSSDYSHHSRRGENTFAVPLKNIGYSAPAQNPRLKPKQLPKKQSNQQTSSLQNPVRKEKKQVKPQKQTFPSWVASKQFSQGLAVNKVSCPARMCSLILTLL